MKSKYRKLKFSILLQSLLAASLTILVASIILQYIIGGTFKEVVSRAVIRVMVLLGMRYDNATLLYWKLIGSNRELFMILGFLLLFSFFFYASLTKMTKYLEQVGEGIENIISDSTEPIRLITELKPIELRLNEIKATIRRQEIEAMNSEKKRNDLILFLAHDLKTPLTSILAYLSMLEQQENLPAEERKKYLKIASEKAIRLEELVNEFFEITKLNMEEIEINKTEVNVSLMLEQIADELYGVLQEKRLTCEVEVEDNLMIEGDPDKLARVFDNILRNAMAYCYEDTKIQIEGKKKDKTVMIRFINQGDRIPGDMLQTIFEKFYRVDNSRSSGTGGAGLGLAIAQEILELHKGKIMAKSDDLQTQFIVSLPLLEGEES
ncbi:signal transduction histidine kinase [Aequitasia blattaphilus]|uniref:histidine kinase n=1 Tax=Aequitasia blattaphilus TaxID=2949332 RepID=A0ABT1E9Q2_9FIRM|nr:HAMP domain-containing sensor histidine kinase [Aequitasia blattaphilus]MCP1102554.1 HAMP domain-containing histidine kinase [Aequitasia blattaphilus]MCR8615194.1 HAMP domain-containing histidine kinase [Aequitasia blattaphilus]